MCCCKREQVKRRVNCTGVADERGRACVCLCVCWRLCAVSDVAFVSGHLVKRQASSMDSQGLAAIKLINVHTFHWHCCRTPIRQALLPPALSTLMCAIKSLLLQRRHYLRCVYMYLYIAASNALTNYEIFVLKISIRKIWQIWNF